ncbi:MAG TPA: mechanosensitive ion channel family protein [Gaiellales bacterium]|jgi:small-conductance mechanosensitive channel|nr:mechanosensitive ion channel family protein [Gaiellales bacterium]
MIGALQNSVPLSGNWRTAALIVGSFVLAWVLAKASGRVAEIVTRWWERRQGASGPSPDDTAALRGLKRRDTAVSLIRTTVRYVAFGLALAFSFLQISGFSRVTALAGASLLVVLIGFAGQRFLTDIIAGLLMFFEGWFSVGDTITVEPWSLSGVVEEMSLRSTTLRAVTGEMIRVNNSAIYAARVLPRGVREVEIEMMATDADDCRRVVEEVARIVPAGPTRFVRRPEVIEVEQLDDELVRVLVHASVAHGREWLVEGFLPDLLKERAAEGLIAHGPIVMFVDERATRRFARSLPGSRGRRPRAGAHPK